MSRSYHATRCSTKRALYQALGGAPGSFERYREEMRDVRRKRAVKRQVRVERRLPSTADLPPVDGGAVPVRILERGAHLHCPLAPEALRELMRSLPPGLVNGLTEVRLELGLEACEDHADDDGDDEVVRDPWSGRASHLFTDGVFGGRVLGQYDPALATIKLFAYAADPERGPDAVVEAFLAVEATTTFLHELGHHEDHARRAGRGRWPAGGRETRERFADACEAHWFREVGGPCLERSHGAELQALRRWLRREAGLVPPLELVAGNWRWKPNGQLELLRHGGVRSALDYLRGCVASGEALVARRNVFARNLAAGGLEEEALAAADNLLADVGEAAPALATKAALLRACGEEEAGRELARRAVELDPGCPTAWTELARGLEDDEVWAAALAMADEGVAALDGAPATGEEPERRMDLLLLRAEGRLRHGRLDEATRDCQDLLALGSRPADTLLLVTQLLLERDPDAARARIESVTPVGTPLTHVVQTCMLDALAGAGGVTVPPAQAVRALRLSPLGPTMRAWLRKLEDEGRADRR